MSRWAPWKGSPLGSGAARALVGLAAAATVLGFALPAEAVPMVFTDEEAFLAAVGTVVIEDFEDTPTGALAAGTNDIGLFNIIIDIAGTRPRIRTGGDVNGTVELDALLCDAAPCSGPFSMEWDFGGTVFGFAADWDDAATSDLLTVTVNEVTFSFNTQLGGFPGTGFLGIVDPDGFSSVSFGLENPMPPNGGEVWQVDDVRIALTLPEPVPLVLLGLALSGLALPRRRGGA